MSNVMSIQITGTLDKLRASLDGVVSYRLLVGEEEVELNRLIGQPIRLTYTGNIFVVHAAKRPRKATHKATAMSV